MSDTEPAPRLLPENRSFNRGVGSDCGTDSKNILRNSGESARKTTGNFEKSLDTEVSVPDAKIQTPICISISFVDSVFDSIEQICMGL